MKQTGFKRPVYVPAPSAPVTRATRAATYAGDLGGAVPKEPRAKSGADERQHKARLVLMGCMVCLRIHGPHAPGPVELHHLRGGGWGKGDWTTLIPLCFLHHRGPEGIHQLGTREWERRLGCTQAQLLADVRLEAGL